MGLFSPMHLLIVAIFIVVVFGPHKVPEFMRGLGKGMGELQKGIDESKRMMTQAMNEVHDETQPEMHPYVAPIPDAPKVEDLKPPEAPVVTAEAENPEAKPVKRTRKPKTVV